MGSTNSTRVKAPDSPAAGTPSVQFADLTAVGLSSIGDAHSLMKADTVAATSGPCSMDLRSTVKVATWNILTHSVTMTPIKHRKRQKFVYCIFACNNFLSEDDDIVMML